MQLLFYWILWPRMSELDTVKTAGCSWIDVDGRLQAFFERKDSSLIPSPEVVHVMLNGLLTPAE